MRGKHSAKIVSVRHATTSVTFRSSSMKRGKPDPSGSDNSNRKGIRWIPSIFL